MSRSVSLVRPNVRAEPTAEAGAAWPRKDPRSGQAAPGVAGRLERVVRQHLIAQVGERGLRRGMRTSVWQALPSGP